MISHIRDADEAEFTVVGVRAGDDLVDLVDEDDAVLLSRLQRLPVDLQPGSDSAVLKMLEQFTACFLSLMHFSAETR